MAQQVEQLIRNQQVAGPNPATSSKKTAIPRVWRFFYANEQFVTVGTCRLFLRGPRKTFVLWGEQKVAGPNPANSKKTAIPRVWRFFYANEQFVTVGTCRLFLRGPRKTFVLWGEQKVAGPNPANSKKTAIPRVWRFFYANEQFATVSTC